MKSKKHKGKFFRTGAPLIIAGVLKIVYDFSLYRSFKTIKPHEEQTDQ